MSEPNNVLRIDALSVRNFRCFAECSLQLHPTLTVLVADNALGKTALLDALRLALNVFVTTMGRGKQCRGFERTDVHLVRGEDTRMQSQLPTQFTAEGCIAGEQVAWSRVLNSNGLHARSSTRDTKAMRAAAQRLADRPDVWENTKIDSPTLLPIAAFYGTGRLWDEHRLTQGKRWLASANPVRVSAYLDCLSPSSSYKSFAAWYDETAESVRDPRFRALGPDERPEKHLTAVREAVRTVLEPTGWTAIDWEFASRDDAGQPQGRGYIVVEHAEKGRLPLSHLSDGVRNMVALIGDLTHRCARLNPHLGEAAARLTPGILMIDEVDMHLHPKWQQSVVGLLQSAFPKIQLILSTHSPHVLSTVEKDSIRVIRIVDGHGDLKTPEYQTRGVMSADVLATIMGVDPVPHVEEAQWVNDYRALIENDNFDSQAAQTLRLKLNGHFGETHPLLLDCDRLIRFQSFKRRRTH